MPELNDIAQNTASGAFAGALIGMIREAWNDKPTKPGHVTLALRAKSARILRTSAIFAAGAGTFFASRAAVRSVRGEDDWKTAAMAGCASGAVFASRGGSRQAAAGCAGLGVTMMLAHMTDYQLFPRRGSATASSSSH